jgi:hypothetical protein
MKLALVLIGLCATKATYAYADRIILDPSAYSLTSGFDGTMFQSSQNKPKTISCLEVGSEFAQAEVSYIVRPGVDRLAVGAQSTVLPETFETPAVAIGVQDLANSTGGYRADGFYGREYYLVATKGLDNNLIPPKIHNVVLSAGLGLGGLRGVFGGISAGLPLNLLGTAEYDSRTMNYKVGLPLGKNAGLSFDRLGNTDFVGLSIHSNVTS